MTNALVGCMSSPASIVVSTLETKIKDFDSKKYIDPVSNLKNSKVFLFSGLKDTTVNPQVVHKSEELYKKFGADVKTEYTLNAVHTQPTDDSSLGSCTVAGSPYISNCKYNGAFEALNFISSRAPLN
jgi:hypothetical protein